MQHYNNDYLYAFRVSNRGRETLDHEREKGMIMLGRTYFHIQIHTLLVCQVLIGFHRLQVHVVDHCESAIFNQDLIHKQCVNMGVKIGMSLSFLVIG